MSLNLFITERLYLVQVGDIFSHCEYDLDVLLSQFLGNVGHRGVVLTQGVGEDVKIQCIILGTEYICNQHLSALSLFPLSLSSPFPPI